MTLKQSWNLDGLAIFHDLRFVLRLHIRTCGKNKMESETSRTFEKKVFFGEVKTERNNWILTIQYMAT